MVADELVPVLARHGVRERPYGLLGWSMGGYGALLLGEKLGPGVVSTVVAESPALWTSVDRRNPRAFDSAADYRANDVWAGRSALAGTAIRIDCGTADGFCPAVRRFTGGMRPEPAGGFTDGGHDPAFWRSAAPAQLRWAAAHLAAGPSAPGRASSDAG
jgi:S-formylglutathione hydrolase FrmB